MAHWSMMEMEHSDWMIGYKPPQNPLRSCINPGLVSRILRYFNLLSCLVERPLRKTLTSTLTVDEKDICLRQVVF